jgi:hypothetical protein
MHGSKHQLALIDQHNDHNMHVLIRPSLTGTSNFVVDKQDEESGRG